MRRLSGDRDSLRRWARVGAALIGLLLVAALPAWPAAETLRILQPPCLSSVEATPLRVQLAEERSGPLAYTLTLSDEGDQVHRILTGTLALDRGAGTLWIDPASLSAFSLGETVVLTLETGSLTTSAEATLLPRPALPEAGTWAITFSGKPAQVYTTRDTSLVVSVTNPKSVAKSAQIKVKFITAKGKSQGQAAASVSLPPGTGQQQVPVTASLATTVKAKEATQAKVLLVVGGIVRASETVPLDYDLAAEGSASPESGWAPLSVDFTGSATGGTPPFGYAWDFGDGGSSSEPSPHHTFEQPGTFPWTLSVTDSVNGTASASGTVTVTQRPTHVLTVTLGTGAVGLPGAGTHTYAEGEAASYAYTAASCYGSLAVTLDGAPVPASGTVTMNADHTLAVTAALKTFTLTATAGSGGSISPAGATVVDCGASQSYTITPNAGYHIHDVRVDDISVGVVPAYTFTDVTASHTIAATFSLIPNQTLTVSLGTGTGGTPAATAVYPQGTVVGYAYALTDPCYTGLVVTLDGAPVPASGTVTMNADHTLSTTAVLKTFTIDASAGSGGSISPPDKTTVACGGSQAYTITPRPLSFVDDVRVDGASVGAVSSYTFTDVRDEHTILATFSPSPHYTLSVTMSAGTAGKPSETATYAEGTVVEYAYALADETYGNLTVMLDGESVLPTGTVTMNANHSLAVTATPKSASR